MKAMAALDDGDAKLLFELADAAGQRRLRDVARLRRAGEVLFAGKRDKILKLADIHVPWILINSQPPTTNSQEKPRRTRRVRSTRRRFSWPARH